MPNRERGRRGSGTMNEAAVAVVMAAWVTEWPSSSKAIEYKVDREACGDGEHHRLGRAECPAHPHHRRKAHEQDHCHVERH
eukprot:scaffold140738_cov31-Tisochrysis_lutea.AAC.2